MFVPPPLVEFTSVESEVKKRRARTGDVLPDGILEFRFIDEGWNGTNGLRRVARGRAEKGWADRVCSGVVIGNYSGPNGERGENETPSSENDARAALSFVGGEFTQGVIQRDQRGPAFGRKRNNCAGAA